MLGDCKKSSKNLDLTGAMTDIGAVPVDELLRKLIQAVKIIARMSNFHRFESQPVDHFLYSYKILLLFSRRIRVIKAQVAISAVEPGEPEINHDRFGMPQVEESIGLRRKARDNSPYASHGILAVYIGEKAALEH